MRRMIVSLLLLVFGMNILPVQAQSDCDTVVVDEANVFGGNLTSVEQAALTLQAQSGAIVRIRTFTDIQADTLPAVNQRVVARCESWRAYNGELNDDFIVFMIAYEQRDTTLVYGNRWATMLDSQWERIVDGMNTYFPGRDFSGGFVYGITETSRVIDLHLHPPTLPPPPTQAPVVPTSIPATVNAPVQPVQAQPQVGFDMNRVIEVAGWLILVLGVGSGVVLIVIVIVTVQRKNAKRRLVVENATEEQRITGELYSSLFNRLQDFLTLLNTKKGELSETTYSTLLGEHERVDGLLGVQAEPLLRLTDTYGDPLREGLTLEEALNVQDEYSRIHTALDSVASGASALEEALRQHQVDAEQAPQDVASLEVHLTRVLTSIDEVSAHGYRVQMMRGQVDTFISSVVPQIRKLIEAKEYGAARTQCTEIQRQADEQLTAATEVMARHIRIQTTVKLARNRLGELQIAITDGRRIFDDIDDRYAEACWRAVRGNGTEAENRFNWSDDALTEAETAMSIEHQEWEKAEQLVVQVETWLGEGESYMRSISALEQTLAEAERTASGDLADLLRDIDTAAAFVADHDEDIDEDVEDRLAAAKRLAEQVQAILGEAKPDYLEALRLLKQADTDVDAIAETAQEQFDAADRLRKKAAKALRDALAAVSKAEEYIADHESDVEQHAKDVLLEAQVLLRRAQETGNLTKQIEMVEDAEEKARDAYEQAEDNVDDAEEARRPRYTSSSSVYNGWGTTSSSPSFHHTSPSIPSFTPSTSGGTHHWSAPAAPKTGGGTKGW